MPTTNEESEQKKVTAMVSIDRNGNLVDLLPVINSDQDEGVIQKFLDRVNQEDL